MPTSLAASLGFPGIFRGALDVRARTITAGMALAAAAELAQCAQERALREDYIVPRMDEWELYPRVAAATAVQAQKENVARLVKTEHQLLQEAEHIIGAARAATHLLMEHRLNA